MMHKRVLVTGASGFIGRNLYESLSRDKFEVFGTHRERKFSDSPKLMRVDLTKEEEVQGLLAMGFDVVIHAAAVTSGSRDIIQRPYIHVTPNDIMNSLLLRAVYDNAVSHFVFLSCTVMYPMDLDRPAKETDVDFGRIHKLYFGGAWMKTYAEKLCEFYSRFEKTKFTVVRHSNIYGPYDKYDERAHIFGATVRNVLETGEGGVITVSGDGSDTRDLLHVFDLVRFIESAIDRQEDKHEVVNVGLGSSIALGELVTKSIQISGKDLRLVCDPARPHIRSRLALDITWAREKFGWSPHIGLGEGIKRTLEWYSEIHPDKIRQSGNAKKQEGVV